MRRTLILLLVFYSPLVLAQFDSASLAAIKARIQPVGKVYIADQSANQNQLDTTSVLLKSTDIGARIFATTCSTCHANGVAGAPKYRDVDAWRPRVAKGLSTLLQHVKEGYNAMPPRGTCVECTDADLRKAIEFMTAPCK